MRRSSQHAMCSALLYLGLAGNLALADEAVASPVIAAAIERGPVTNQVSTYGTLSPKIEELSFKIAGRIARFAVEEGASVTAGQLLAQLETQDAEDRLHKQTVELGQVERNYQRMKTLHDKGSIQKSQLEDSAARREQVRIAHEQAKLNLRRCSLRATSAGLVLKEFLESRTTVSAGQPIYSFQSYSAEWTTKVDLTDRNAFAMGEGARARIRFAPYPGVDFAGELSKLARIANPEDALYTAEITITAGDYALRPGMVAEVDLYQTSEQSYSLVPFDALVDLRGRSGNIYVLDESRKAVQQLAVTLVAVQGLQAALKEDLGSYHEVVIRGQQNLQDGSHIRIME
jgi:RND family efflux transporter MFP subunit